jgi:hypothetical protein
MKTTNTPDLTGLPPIVADKIAPMIDDLLGHQAAGIHSIHITGSAVISDYDEKKSDINSVVVLHRMDLAFIEFLAPLGRKFGKKKIAAPLVMTPDYIADSLDAFPVEFLDLKLIHKTIYGPDLFTGLQIIPSNLRLQCEREIKTKQIHLRQGYLSSLGKKELLSALLVRSFTGSMALFRAVISLLGKEPPIPRQQVIRLFQETTGVDTAVFEKILALKAGNSSLSEQDLRSLFERYYNSLEAVGKIIDALPQ